MKVRELVEKLNQDSLVHICDVNYRNYGGFALNHSEERGVVLSNFGDFKVIAFNLMFANDFTKRDVVYIHAVIDKEIDLDYEQLKTVIEIVHEE